MSCASARCLSQNRDTIVVYLVAQKGKLEDFLLPWRTDPELQNREKDIGVSAQAPKSLFPESSLGWLLAQTLDNAETDLLGVRVDFTHTGEGGGRTVAKGYQGRASELCAI